MPPEQTPTPQPEPSSRILPFSRLQILVGVLILLIITTVGYKSFALYRQQKEIEQQQRYEKSLADFKTKWGWLKDAKTYRNEEYGFEMKYPPGVLKPVQIVQNGNSIDFKYYGEMYNNYITSFKITVRENPSKLNLKQWFSVNIDSDDLLIKNGTFELSTLNGNEIMTLNASIPDEYLDKEGPIPYSIFIMPIDKTYVLALSRGQDVPPSPDVMKQILSTFKFIEPTKTGVEGQFCGGIAAIQCPAGYKCMYEGSYPDAGGKCAVDIK